MSYQSRRERERERQRQRQRQTETDRQTERERQTDTQTHRDTDRETKRENEVKGQPYPTRTRHVKSHVRGVDGAEEKGEGAIEGLFPGVAGGQDGAVQQRGAHEQTAGDRVHVELGATKYMMRQQQQILGRERQR